MLTNRSIPACSVIPELPYRSVTSAADWLSRAFGFSVRLRIADHRIQMNVNGCAIVLVAAGDMSRCKQGVGGSWTYQRAEMLLAISELQRRIG
jgi:hypothetical protein